MLPIPSFAAPQSFLYRTFPVFLCALGQRHIMAAGHAATVHSRLRFLLHRYYGNSFFILPVRPVQDTRAFSSPPRLRCYSLLPNP